MLWKSLEMFRVGVCLTAVMSMLDRVAPVPAQVYDCNKAHFVVVGCFPLCFWEVLPLQTNSFFNKHSLQEFIQQFPYSFRFWEVFSDRLDNSTKQQSGWAWLGYRVVAMSLGREKLPSS